MITLKPGNPKNATLKLVRDMMVDGHIRPQDFDMHNFNRFVEDAGKFCGTVRCIGGWMVALESNKSYIQPSDLLLGTRLSDYFHVPASLFFPEPTPEDTVTYEIDYSSITIDVAVKCINHYLETGIVDWLKAGARAD